MGPFPNLCAALAYSRAHKTAANSVASAYRTMDGVSTATIEMLVDYDIVFTDTSRAVIKRANGFDNYPMVFLDRPDNPSGNEATGSVGKVGVTAAS